MLCSIHTGPSFHQGVHTKNGLDFLLAHGPGPIGLVRPYFLFLSSSYRITKKGEMISIEIYGLGEAVFFVLDT